MVAGRAWLAANVDQAQGVSEDAWKVVSDFSLLWSLFEAKLCDTFADAPKLVGVANGFGGKALDAPMQEAFNYWRGRYVDAAGTNQRFNELFHRPIGRDIAGPILVSAPPDEAAKLRCLLLIVYRLRNNLFHGTKEIRTFNEQKDNLGHGCNVLANVMDWAKAADPTLF